MLRMVRLDRLQDSAGFEEEYLSGCLLSRLATDDLPDADVIVYGCDTRAPPAAVIDAIAATDRPVLLHLSNESLEHDFGYYAQARWVFRSYFDPGCTLPHVSTVPLGYRSGFAAAQAGRTGERKRDFAWAFAGQKKSNRAVMAAQMERITPHFTHYTSDWLSADMLTVEQVCDVYARTQFIPCPMGNINPDSFRVMEALENGCIPVVTRFYGYDLMKYTFGDHPFVVGNDWADCARIVRRMLKQPDALAARARATEAWYRVFKKNLADDIARIVRTGSIATCKGEQFAYQRRGQVDPFLRAAFAWHFREKHRFLHRVGRAGEMLTPGRRRVKRDAA